MSNEEGENKKREKSEKEKKREQSEKEKNKSKESGDEFLTTKTKSQLAGEARKEILVAPVKDIPYPLVRQRKRGSATLLLSLTYSRSWRSTFHLKKPYNRCLYILCF